MVGVNQKLQILGTWALWLGLVPAGWEPFERTLPGAHSKDTLDMSGKIRVMGWTADTKRRDKLFEASIHGMFT